MMLASGCGSGSGARHKLVDSDRTFNAFITAVRDYYATRTDGTLSEPTLSDSKASFLYHYKEVKGGNHTEHVELDAYTTKASDPEPVRMRGSMWSVGAWFKRDGPDPEIVEIEKDIDARMMKILDPAPKP